MTDEERGTAILIGLLSLLWFSKRGTGDVQFDFGGFYDDSGTFHPYTDQEGIQS